VWLALFDGPLLPRVGPFFLIFCLWRDTIRQRVVGFCPSFMSCGPALFWRPRAMFPGLRGALSFECARVEPFCWRWAASLTGR